MAEKTTLNPMQQIMAAARAQQGAPNAAIKAGQDETANPAASFSQALKSASSRVSDATGKQAEAVPSRSKSATQDEESSDTTTQAPDAASQAAALFALQASLLKTAAPEVTKTTPQEATKSISIIVEDKTTSSDATAATQALASLIPTAKPTVELATSTNDAAATPASLAATAATAAAIPTAQAAVATPDNKSTASPALGESPVTAAVVTTTSASQPQGDPASTGNNDSDKKPLADQRTLIADTEFRTRAANRDTESVAPTTTFSAELNNAQAAYGIKTEARLESQATVSQYTVNTPVNAHNWADEVGARLNWVASKDNGRAELVLNPPHMGKIEVSINLNGDQASASFTAANPSTRDALQDALPRLREVLADAGIQLGQANVNAGGSGQTQAEQNAARSSSQTWRSADAGTLSTELASDSLEKRIPRSNGLVDLFA